MLPYCIAQFEHRLGAAVLTEAEPTGPRINLPLGSTRGGRLGHSRPPAEEGLGSARFVAKERPSECRFQGRIRKRLFRQDLWRFAEMDVRPIVIAREKNWCFGLRWADCGI